MSLRHKQEEQNQVSAPSRNEQVQGWIKILAPILLGVFGTLLGGGVTWGIAKAQLAGLERAVAKQDLRIEQLEDNELLWVEKFATLETKIDILVSDKIAE